MGFYIAIIETDEELPFGSIELDGSHTVHVHSSVDSVEQFVVNYQSGLHALQEVDEFRKDISFIFNTGLRTLMEHGIFTPEGKINLEGYTTASYLEFALKVAREQFDKLKANEREELQLVNDYQAAIKFAKQKLRDPKIDQELANELSQKIAENEAFVNKDRMSSISKKGRDMAIEMAITGIKSGLRIMEKGKTLDFDYYSIVEAYRPASEILMKWGLRGLEHDETFLKIQKQNENDEQPIN